MSEMDQTPASLQENENSNNKKRRFWLIALTTLFIGIMVLYAFYWFLVARFYEETDNAYVNGNIIPITSQVAGTIIAVKADDTQFVHKGQLLIQLDPIDTIVAFQQAKANLAQTVRNTQQLFINNKGLQANIVDRAVQLEKARNDLLRRDQAVGVGAVSREELIHAQDTYKSADAFLIQARSALLSNQAQTENTTLEQHPSVLAAAARLRQTYIDYRRTMILAPATGEIAKRSAQIGQRIAAGTQLMALVPLDQVWVDANFKERQLGDMRIGQPVTLTADIYDSSVKYHGKVQGFAAGTGSAFALLPAQNATGNWIKVVQRLPVRIQLDPKELEEHPLRIGLSMKVTVDLHDTSGKFVSESASIPTYDTDVYAQLNKESDAEIAKIIQENAGKTANLDALDNLVKSSSKIGSTKRHSR